MAHSPEANRRQDESLDQYLIRLGDSLSLYELNWNQVAELMNSQPEVEDDYSESKYRKDYSSYLKWKDYITVRVTDGDDYLSEIKDAALDLKKERIKVQAEKLELNKLVREQARAELLEEKIIEAINYRPTISVPNIIIKDVSKKKDILFPVADMHDGVHFTLKGWEDEILNEYSPEILEKRMWNLLEEFVAVNDLHKINHVTLPNLGDSIDGILRMSQLMSLKLGVTDSAIHFAEFMSQWLNELTKYALVDYYSIQGNHDQMRMLSGKRDEFPHENAQKWITKLIQANLKSNDKIKVHPCKEFMYIDILGTKVLGVHGENEKNLENSIKDYVLTYGKQVHLLLSGHLHHAHEKTIGMSGMRDIEHVQVPAIIGIDDYSLKLKKTSNAGAKIMIIEENLGRTITHNIKLR